MNPCFINPCFIDPCFINLCFINPVHVLPIQSSPVHILSYAIYNAFQYSASEDPDRVETLVSQFEEEP